MKEFLDLIQKRCKDVLRGDRSLLKGLNIYGKKEPFQISPFGVFLENIVPVLNPRKFKFFKNNRESRNEKC